MRWPLLTLFLASCGAPDSRPVALTQPSGALGAAGAASARAPVSSDSRDVRIEMVARPSNLQIDGDLAEWPARTTDASRPSSLAVAVTTEGVFLSGDLGPAAKDGLSIAISSPAPPMPAIGESVARGGGIESLTECDYETEDVCSLGCSTHTTDKKKPPEVAAACHALLDNYAKLVASHTRRFSRQLRIDARGVSVRDESGTFVPVAAAKLAWVPKEGREVFEAALPLAVLPRLSEAPLQALSIRASVDQGNLPDAPSDEAKRNLPAPLSFEPHADIRAALIIAAGACGVGAMPTPECGAAISYDATDPEHVETMDYVGPSKTPYAALEPHQGTLYQPKAKLGDIELGVATARGPSVVILKNGKLVDAEHDLLPIGFASTLEGIIERDGELHVIISTPGIYSGPDGRTIRASFRVVAVGPNGVQRDAAVSLEDELYKVCDGMHVSNGVGGTASVDKTFATLRFRGRCDADREKNREVGYEATWRWSPEKKMYTGSVVRTR